jgi:hypothetical protein
MLEEILKKHQKGEHSRGDARLPLTRATGGRLALQQCFGRNGAQPGTIVKKTRRNLTSGKKPNLRKGEDDT